MSKDDGVEGKVARRDAIARFTSNQAHHPALAAHQPLTRELPPRSEPNAFVEELVAMIRSDSDASTGPFYRALFDGKVSAEGARLWIQQFYYDARAFPPLVAQVIANAEVYYDVRQLVGGNLHEELGYLDPAREHPQLLKKIGAALGVSEQEMEFAKPIPEVLLFCEYRHKLVRDAHCVEGLAAGLLSVELAIPARYLAIAKALETQFGVPRDAMEFLWIHAGNPETEGNYGGDIEHAMEASNIIARYATTAGMQDRVRLAVWKSLEARKVYQWGLYRACVLEKDARYKSEFSSMR